MSIFLISNSLDVALQSVIVLSTRHLSNDDMLQGTSQCKVTREGMVSVFVHDHDSIGRQDDVHYDIIDEDALFTSF